MGLVGTMRLFCCSTRADIDAMYMNECGSVPTPLLMDTFEFHRIPMWHIILL